MFTNIVFPEELVYFVESIKPFQVVDIASEKWLDVHEMIVKLNQQAALEASEDREEEVKEILITRDKLKVLISEAYCVLLWKTRVLPHLLEIDPNPQATFLIYTTLFHEASVIALLDISLYHFSACESLKDYSLDVVDYSAQAVAQLIGLASLGYIDADDESKVDIDEAVLTELERQKRNLIVKIGFRCISILSYLADNSSALSSSTIRRMIVTHDVPWLIVDLLTIRPWQRKTKNGGIEKYVDHRWTAVEGDAIIQVTKHEAQAWFCLRQLVFNDAMKSYEMNEERCKHFTKVQGLLHESLLDQLPPLIELKQYLCQITMSGKGSASNSNLILEELPEIRDQLIKEAEKHGGFLGIAHIQEKIFLCTEKEKICSMAKRLNLAYNTDLLAELEEKFKANQPTGNKTTPEPFKCGKCGTEATKKCSKCKNVYYCSRTCQLDDWPQHKQVCA